MYTLEMGAPRFIQLTSEENEQLYTLEHFQGIDKKVRLRASIIRLSNQGFSVPILAKHFKRNQASIHNDFNRWEQSKFEGLVDGNATGMPTKFTPEIIIFLKEKISEDRAWDCTQLAVAIQDQFKISIAREAIRLNLISLGYTWQRSRYISEKIPDPEIVKQNKADIDTLKRGHWRSV